eukprot:5848365-Lingulodinium_polyedra.AAC.1
MAAGTSQTPSRPKPSRASCARGAATAWAAGRHAAPGAVPASSPRLAHARCVCAASTAGGGRA